MPPARVATLYLSWLSRQPGVLVDGSIDIFDVFIGSVMWDGRQCTVKVESADTEPLLGMNLLDRHENIGFILPKTPPSLCQSFHERPVDHLVDGNAPFEPAVFKLLIDDRGYDFFGDRTVQRK